MTRDLSGVDRLADRGDKWAGDVGNHPFRATLKLAIGGTLIVLVLVALVGFITTGSAFWGAFAAKATAGARVTQQVYDPNNIISNVNFFTTTCEDVGRDYANWQANQSNYQRELQLAQTATTVGAQTEAQNAAQQLSNYISGALAQIQADAATYNAKSINYTANPFKSANLPYRISVPAFPNQLNNWSPPSCG